MPTGNHLPAGIRYDYDVRSSFDTTLDITVDASRTVHQKLEADTDRCVEEVRESGDSCVCGACHANSLRALMAANSNLISLPM